MQLSTLIDAIRPSTDPPVRSALRRIEATCPKQQVTRGTPTQAVDAATEIHRALRATGYLALRKLSIRVAEGLAILRGRVPSYFLKQKAQAVALEVPGVTEVQNELDVVAPRPRCP